MCSVFGAVLNIDDLSKSKSKHLVLRLMGLSAERGRDGYGLHLNRENGGVNTFRTIKKFDVDEARRHFNFKEGSNALVGNFRAEPTTEYVKEKCAGVDQQPYTYNGWSIAHNGTIANDKELRTHKLKTKIDSAAIAETLPQITEQDIENELVFDIFYNSICTLKGSFAILATNKLISDRLYVAANYRPVWYVVTSEGVLFASCRTYLEEKSTLSVPQMLQPYTVAEFDKFGILESKSLPTKNSKKALVVCSGGLDSVTAATAMIAEGYEVELAHFVYGCRAEQHEVEAVHAVSEYLDVPLHVIPMSVYDPKDSPLLRKNEAVAGGEEGAEFAHEWVPARNLVMLSYATAFSEANGFHTIALGNNLEEAGAYPDNEPEFIKRFADLLPFAVRDGYKLEVVQPVGNLMKHEIVALGHKLGAPLHLTWSCYKHGDIHCGQCGPCFMRKTAFEINNLDEVIPYETDGE